MLEISEKIVSFPARRKVSQGKKKAKNSKVNLIPLFGQTSKITASLVFLPIIISLLGLFLDKKLGLTPKLTIGGIVLGFILGFAHAIYLTKKYLKP